MEFRLFFPLVSSFVSLRSTPPPHFHQNQTDVWFMTHALEQAKFAYDEGEVPVGALVVTSDGQVISKTHNLVCQNSDPTAHAEMLALRQATSEMRNWRLVGCTLYTTLEPCAMCLASMQLARIQRVVFGASDLRLGAVKSYLQLLNFRHPFHNNMTTTAGVMEKESIRLLKTFFLDQRKRNQFLKKAKGTTSHDLVVKKLTCVQEEEANANFKGLIAMVLDIWSHLRRIFLGRADELMSLPTSLTNNSVEKGHFELVRPRRKHSIQNLGRNPAWTGRPGGGRRVPRPRRQ